MSNIDYDKLLETKNSNKKSKNILDKFNNISKININELENNKNNKYPLVSIEELANSILQFGLLDPIIVKNINGKNTIIAGHRRTEAHRYLVEHGYKEFEMIEYSTIEKEEEEIVTKIKLHESNLQARPLNKMSVVEKQVIVNDYLELIKEAREKGLMIKGRAVKGKTKDILADMLGISPRTANDLIVKNKGVQNCTPHKTEEEKKAKEQKKFLNQMKKMIKNNYLDSYIVQELTELLNTHKEINKNKPVVLPGQESLDID